MNYEFDRKSLNRSQRHPVRSIVIFLVVLIITAGIIYLIVPHGKKAAAGKEVPPARKVPETPPAEKTPSDNPAAKENNEAETADISGAPATETEKTEPEDQTKTTGTETPVKGVPWAGDPVVDAPEKTLPPETLARENAAAAENWKSLSGKESAWVVRHDVVRGDNLERLARRYHTTVSLIREMNHLKSDVIYLGAKLKIVPGPWRIDVSKSTRRLTLVNLAQKEERVFASYDIGIGRAGSTPAERFVVSFRIYHPDYLAPDGAVFPYGSAENPLGDYFLKLAPEKTKDKPLAGYGIHGSPDDAGVGRSLSHGCIRMRNDEVRQLYMLCPTGTPVLIAD